ncbi:hypothetical protein PV08_01927 [Exophiala spinifera]|uniref:Uncharacterized protein n=1 Tax=Exophiala spinifera TaxID=91928 RepID=A0A0D2A986_9EURO|nr:uncharacterized protein PV08_01927 [Exophiala spinifera]KIW21347.1 hypothetical protein PV08_01927 [Exophiala spinifera]
MAQVWPPSPCVEDEDVSLSKELLLDVPIHKTKNDDQPAGSRGSVDQYPIIIDSDDSDTTSKQHGSDSDDVPSQPHSGHASAESTTNTEKRFVLFSPERSEVVEEPPLEDMHRSRSTPQLNIREEHRGRPQVTRIHTDLGPSRESMAADRHREPSPYAYSNQSTMDSTSAGPRSGINLLSPMDANRSRRSLPVRQRSHPQKHDSSDSEHGSKSKRRPGRSRSRAPRKSFSQTDRPEIENTKSPRRTQLDSRTTEDYSYNTRRHGSAAPSKGDFVGYSSSFKEHITPPQSPKPLPGSTRSSLSESARDHAYFRHGTDQVITDSPYTSSADEGRSRRQISGDEKRGKSVGRSRRASSRLDLQEIDRTSTSRATSRHRDRGSRDVSSPEPVLSDERRRREPDTPLSARALKATEDYFGRALGSKQSRKLEPGNDQSRPVSPLSSPSASPPRPPRGDKMPRHDFQPPSSAANTSKPRSRPPSQDDSHSNGIKPLTTLLSAATLGASLAKAIPTVSRSIATSLNSAESLNSGSQSRPSNGDRSRKASPDLFIRTSSVPGRDEGPSLRVTTYPVHDERTQQRSSTYTPTPAESPRTAARAASYSYPPEISRPAVPHRAMSTSSTQSFHQYLNVTSQQPMVSAPVTPDPVNMSLPVVPRPSVPSPCPRSTPVTGLYDWYTIRDMSFLDFCPSCMNFLGGTRFRDHFIPSMPKDLRQPVQCAMSKPWIRLAWLQCVKHDKKDLSLVWGLTQPPPEGTRACPGPVPEHRRWYHLTDPRTNRPVEGFDICSACVMKIDMTFPQLRSYLFDRPRDKLNEERICNVNTNSRHFWPILTELERLADRRSRESLRQRDIIDFVDYIRRISRHRECLKDTMLAMTAWHFIPDLPEFTICEDCFQEVVWPLRDRPIAREVSRTLKVVPNLQRNQSIQGISCQLYSDRMRRIFHDAVSKNDFECLRAAARHRYSMEHRLQELQRRYKTDQQAGWDRRGEMEQNITIWKSIE